MSQHDEVAGEGRDGWVPAFPGQRPPFPAGHEYTLRHGAYSERKIAPIAAALVDDLLGASGLEYLAAPRWAAEVEAWARLEARVRLLTAYVEDQGSLGLTDEGSATGALQQLDRWEAAAAKARTRLGLTPSSASRLGKDLAQTKQADAAAALTAMREQHERAMRGAPGGTIEGGGS